MPTTAPTERQVAFVNDLAAEVVRLAPQHGPALAASWQQIIRQSTGVHRSNQIDAMISIRDRYRRAARAAQVAAQPAAQPVTTSRIPVGHYAVDGPIAGISNQPVVFFRVAERDGVIRVNQVIGGRMGYGVYGGTRRNEIFTRIEAAGVENAARRYGQEIGRCYVCNTRLTDAESRRLGIGPDCRGGRSARGNAFQGWVNAQATGSTVPAAVRDAARPVVIGPDSGECAVCAEPALGYDRRSASATPACYCDECAIDKNVAITLFARNPRLVTA